MHLEEKKALSSARFAHAQECLESAGLLLENGNFKSAAN